MSRALGDLEALEPGALKNRTSTPLRCSYGLSCEPEFPRECSLQAINLRPLRPFDEDEDEHLIILCSDGLWDMVNPREAAAWPSLEHFSAHLGHVLALNMVQCMYVYNTTYIYIYISMHISYIMYLTTSDMASNEGPRVDLGLRGHSRPPFEVNIAAKFEPQRAAERLASKAQSRWQDAESHVDDITVIVVRSRHFKEMKS